jgi:hypothetical protein
MGRVWLACLVMSILALAACGSPRQSPEEPADTAGPCAPWECEQVDRFTQASAFMGGQKGMLGIMVADRQTGAVWLGGEPALRTWAGSTPKLALAVYLLEEQGAGRLTLSQNDLADIDAMLDTSDNAAADRLWYAHADAGPVMQRWREAYGMAQASYVDGYEQRWGNVKVTPQDLINLMTYVLERFDPTLRVSIVEKMRTVGAPQQWGVWGAGAELRPGVKNGWDYPAEPGSAQRWVTSTVGFVGADERYLVAAMYDQPPEGTIDIGVHVLTDLVAILFAAPVPAPAVVPSGY